MAEQTIICPKCGSRIPVSKALTAQIEADLRESFEAEAEKREREAQTRFEKKLSAEATRVERQVRREVEQIATAELAELKKQLTESQKREKATQVSFEKRLAEEQVRLEKAARKAAEEELSEQIGELQKQLSDKDKKVAEAEKQRTELQKLQRQLEVREKDIESEISRRTQRAVKKAKEELAERIEEEHGEHERELEKKLSDARRQATELKRKLEQSSQQAQGEVAELELEKVLRRAFPEDEIRPVPKGKTGADVLQEVHSSNGVGCGCIIWESKNTRNWSKAWLVKLRTDQRRAKADVAVLVSAAMPNEVSRFGQIDGVWVTESPLALGLAMALRANLIQVALLKQSSKGKNETMEMLYEYLSGVEFRHRVEAVVEAFRSLQDDLDKERQAMEKQWAKRGKQLQLVIQNISGMYGDMQAIAGQSLPRIRRLELPAPQES
jgi:hypothetical protein